MSLALVTTTTGVTPAQLLGPIERKVYGNQRTQLNRLNDPGGISAVDGTLTFEFDAGGIRAGAYLEIDDEVLFVWSVAGQVATVERGMLGTTPAAHADDAVIRVEPRFFRTDMTEEILTEIRSWPTNVYRRYVGTLSLSSTARAVDADGLLNVSDVTLLHVSVDPDETGGRWRTLDARLEPRQVSTSFPSGYALTLPYATGTIGTAQVVARSPYSGVSLATNADFGTIGMTRDLVDIIPWGVAARLLMTRDVARTDANPQGRSRPADEVHVGDAVQVGRALMAQRDQLLAEAANRLLAQDGMGWA